MSTKKRPFYIVGSGSFALKLGHVLAQQHIAYRFVDQHGDKILNGKRVQTFTEVDAGGIFLFAISILEYAQRARALLQAQHICQTQCLFILNDSQCCVLEHAFTVDKERCINILHRDLNNFVDFEQVFFRTEWAQITHGKKSSTANIAFHCVGRSGGYLSHLGQLPSKLSQDYNSFMLSDTVLNQNVDTTHMIMSQNAMQTLEGFDLHITASVFTCTPKLGKKLSIAHMLHDILLFNEQLKENICDTETHYIYLPTPASMLLYQRLCREIQPSNNIVLIPGGYPKLDRSIAQYSKLKYHEKQQVILYAPTLSSLAAGNETQACFSILDAIEFVPEILLEIPEATFIFRPHPEDLAIMHVPSNNPRAVAIKQLYEFCSTHPRCQIDHEQDHYLQSFSRAKILLTDTSSLGLSYALITENKPIFYASDQQRLLADFPDSEFIQKRAELGHLVERNTVLSTVKKLLVDNAISCNTDCAAFTVFNHKNSERYLAQNLDYILEDKIHPDWWYWQHEKDKQDE